MLESPISSQGNKMAAIFVSRTYFAEVLASTQGSSGNVSACEEYISCLSATPTDGDLIHVLFAD
jgi:hypothetical protein